ncbi:hypothetical protein Ctob_010973 [Chrysochromulina tobinii]|uniref:Helicase ATP-binding domain-containing protein n=2 Tax=Chrysochromulina tobinii TaxID=1460289 RepID=A0A0M0K6I7_9EUKA|nr:hypothetical protein Ctob_010973 [Chrysochromulina tobinii]|eukprot:KOO33988.1 hypothetical protein Ctob_010973 [Chrysochromulina sp. CCMP291]
MTSASDIFRDATLIDDPRWDEKGFNEFSGMHARFVSLAYVKGIKDGRFTPSRGRADVDGAQFHDLRDDKLRHAGKTRDKVGLFAVLSATSFDYTGELSNVGEAIRKVEAAEIVKIVESKKGGGKDDDLIMWDFLCVDKADDGAKLGMYRMFTHYRVQTVILTKPPGVRRSVFERLETMAMLALVAFCQRIVNHEDVKEGLELDKLMDLPNLLAPLQSDHKTFLRVASTLEAVIKHLKPVAEDEKGFKVLCSEGDIAWVKATYLKELQRAMPTDGGRPFPRRQDLDQSKLFTGEPPKRKAIVVSHGWDTAFHISPSGEKLDLLVDALERVDAMTDDDGVFIDFCSLPQAAHASMPSIYFQHNGIKTYADKSALEKKQFNFAMWDMSRMYAYSYVIVLPKPTDITKFPGDTSAPLLAKDMKLVLDGEDVLVEGTDPRIVIQYCVKNGKAKTDGSQSFILDRDLAFADNVEFPVGSLKVVLSNVCGWGRVSPLPYQNRGWCCSEFTMALYNRRILNTKDVAQLTYMDSGRPWPKTVAEYDQMMRSGVEFTKRGDADLVKFLFFRMCFGLRHSFFPFEVQDTTGYGLPSEADLMAASREGQVGTGVNDQSKYYLYLALQPPAVQLDGRIWKRSLAQKLHRMQLLMIAKAPHWTGHGHHPVAFGIGDREMTESDLRRGGIHCLVWCSTGCGWETPKPSSDPKSLSIPGLCEVLTSLEPTKRPAVIFVVMPYGARRAAGQLAHALAGGSTLVVWIAENMLDEQRANGVLFGVLAPALQSLHEPWINGLSRSEFTSEVLHKSGQMVFGSQWDAADCLDVSTTVPQLRWAPSSLPQDRPWVHNLTSSFEGMALPRDGAVQTRRMMGTDDDKGEQRYLEVQLIVRENGKEIDVPQLFAREDGQTPEIVFAWLAKALPNGDAKNVTALYSHEVKRASGGWMSTLQVRLMIGEVGYLHQLRDLALTGAPSILEKELSSALLDGRRYEVSVDRAQFALSYEESVLSLDKLTVHQKEKLRECYGTAESNPLHRLLRRSQELFDGTATPSYIHVEAPAGAGKTFVALNYLLSRLQSHPTMTALYVARNRALCLFFVRWIIKREPNPLNRLGLLRRLQVLFEGDEREPPFALGPQRVMLKNGVIQVESSHSDTHNFSLTIVDEAHHIYTNPLCRECVGAYVLPPTEARHLMLLSDISQSSGKDKELYPKGKPKVVTLTEVVRSSQRIVEAASVFQLGDSVHKISCQHSAAGPPLKAFMFNLEGAVPDAVPLMKDLNDGQVRQYAGQTVEAIKHIISMFGSLRLHDRVAIVVDVDILNDFRGTFSAGAYQGGLLGAELLEHFMRRESATKQQIEAGHARSFQIIDATQAASMVMGGSQDDREWLIVDTIEAFDGLERLVVIAVGLDAKIVQGDKTLKTRSLLYRAMTRAHMLAIVVQHNIPGGFFAFLHQVKLDPSAEFDAAKAQKARDSTALNKVMTKGKASSATEQAEMTVPSLSTAVRSLFSRLVGKVEVNFPALSTTVRSLFSRLVGKASSAVAGSDAAADRAALEAGEKKVATLYLTTLGHLICASLLLAKWESLEDLNGGPLNGTRFDSLPTHDAPGLSWFSVFVPSWIAELIVVGMAIWSVMLLPSTARNLRIQHINTIAQTILCALFQLLLAIRLTTQRGSWLVVFSPCAGNGAASSASAGSGAASSDNAGSGAASSASAGSGAAHGEKNLTKQTIWDTSSIEESEEVEAGSVELNPFAAAKTTEGIDAPIEAALRDGAVRLIDVAWLLDSDRSDKQLPRVTKVVARLASNEPTDVLIRQLAKLCGTSSICITVEAASAASPPPSPPPSPPEVAAPAEVQLERFRHELAEAGLSQLAHAIIDDLGIESVEGLCDFTFNELKERLKAEAGVTLDLGHSQKLKAFLAASPSGTSEERMAGGPKVAFSAHGLQPDAKRRCSTKHADAKLTRSLTSSAMLRAQVKNAEAGEGDVESPHLDTSSAASSLGSGRFHSRRRRDSFAEDLTMEAASKSEHPSGKMTARAVVSAKLRRQNETRLPKPGALGSGRMDHNHGIGLEDLDSRPAPFERGASATRKTPNGQLDAHEKSFVVTFHLSTFAEVAPLTAAGLCRKAEAVKERLAELGAEDINIVMGKPFLPRCQDMPPEAFLSPERAADLYARGRRGVYVSSCCWRTSDLPDPDGRTLEKLRGYMKGRHGEYGLFVDFACTPQIFAWPSWHAPEAISRRFGAEVSQGPLTVLKFECERVATEVEAQVCVDKLVSLCSQQGWALASMADFESLGLHSRDYGSALFHGRYVRGAYRFDEDEEALPAEGYVRFRTEGDARAAWRHPELKRLCGGKEPELMGEHVFENELKFERGLSVMPCLFASATGTCVLQFTDQPGELGSDDGAPSELVSERTGTVFVVRTNTSLEELRKELGDGVLAWEKKGWGEFVVRVAGETAARAVRSLNERGYPLRRKDRVVYPMYNLRPYRSRGWPVFDTAVASIVVAYVTQHKRQGKPLPDLVARAEASSPKFINIDVIGAPRVVEVTQSPERLLRACIEKLSSNRIVFTGNVQLRQVSSFVQLLSDLEASIAVEVTGSAPAPLRSPRSQNMVLAENMMNFISS